MTPSIIDQLQPFAEACSARYNAAQSGTPSAGQVNAQNTALQALIAQPQVAALKQNGILTNNETGALCLLALPQLDASQANYFADLSKPNKPQPSATLLADIATTSSSDASDVANWLSQQAANSNGGLVESSGTGLAVSQAAFNLLSDEDPFAGLPAGLVTPVKPQPAVPGSVKTHPNHGCPLIVLVGGFPERQQSVAAELARLQYKQEIFQLHGSVLMEQPDPSGMLQKALAAFALGKYLVYWQDALQAMQQHPFIVSRLSAQWSENRCQLFAGQPALSPIPSSVSPEEIDIVPIEPMTHRGDLNVWRTIGNNLLNKPDVNWERVNDTFTMHYPRVVETLIWAHHRLLEGHDIATNDIVKSYDATSPKTLASLANRVWHPASLTDLIVTSTVLESLKKAVRSYTLAPSKNPNQPAGLCMIMKGPRGTGRKQAAQAVASAIGLPVFSINGAALLHEATENPSVLSALFYLAAANSAALIIDQADRLFASTNGQTSGICSQLIAQLDDFNGFCALISEAKVSPTAFTRPVQQIVFPLYTGAQRVEQFRNLARLEGVRLAGNISLPTLMAKVKTNANGVARIFNRAKAMAPPPTVKGAPTTITAPVLQSAIKQEFAR